MTKKDIEDLRYNDLIGCPFTGQRWYVIGWFYDNRKNVWILSVTDLMKTYGWFVTQEQLKRYIILKKSSFERIKKE